VSAHLRRLEGAAIDSEEVRYFRARTLVLQKKFGEAEALLRRLGASNSGEGFSYRLTNGWWEFPVAFMARLELAKVADLQGKRELALAGYRAALSDLEKTTPVTPPDESFRDLEAWITDGHFAFYRAWTGQAARRALQALLQEPFGSVYSRGQATAGDVRFSEAGLDVTADVPDLGQVRGYCGHDTWNDCISSIRVRRQ